MLKAFFMALGMFSIIPARNSWDASRASLIAPMLPLVGFVIGLIWYGAALATVALPLMLHSVLLALAPIILTGFLHIDGFMDTADAVLSRRPPEEKRRILKDPAVGAFAVVSVVCLILLQFSAAYSFVGRDYTALILIPIISRCIAGTLIIDLEPISQDGYMHMFKERTGFGHKTAIFIAAMAALVVGHFLGGRIINIVLVTTLIATLFMALWLDRQFKGFSGDLCGCAITVGELCGLLALACLS